MPTTDVLIARIRERETRRGRRGAVTAIDDSPVLIGCTSLGHAIALVMGGVTGPILTEIFREVDRRELGRPVRVYGETCTVGETPTFHFTQLCDL